VACVDAVCLRSPFAPAQRGRVGWLGQVDDHAGPLEFVDHEAPARARLNRESRVSAVEPVQPQPQVLPIGGRDATSPDLAALGVQVVERDLPTMKIQTTNDGHEQPPNEDDSDPAIVHQPPDRPPPHAIFFTVEAIWLRRFYVLAFLSIGSRRIEYVACTSKPHTAWMLQRRATS
jgi:hypothetical protein